MWELSSDDDSDASLSLPISSSMNPTAAKLWLHDFNAYLNSRDQLTGDQTIVQWWGANGAHYLVLALLAHDFLSVMASLVSSEHAFSSAGITISKHHNWLKADIVEALQCLKCLIKHNILFQDSDDPSITAEVGLEMGVPGQDDDDGWDVLVDDQEEDEGHDNEIELLILDEI